jgi:2-enoate reductase
MTGKYQPLFEPLQVGALTLPNRFVMCAMEGANIVEGLQKYEFNRHCRAFYLERARSGVGLLIPGMVPVRNLVSNKWLYRQEKLFMGPVKDLLAEIHQYDSKVFLQIGAGMGRSMTAVEPLDSLAKSPAKRTLAKALGMDVLQAFQAPDAGLPNVWDPEILSRQMTTEDVERVIDGFGRSAALAKRAGFDGVEIHALHEGYLLDQFATAATNHRTDRFGGSPENRARFATEIVRSIKAACGEDFPVSMRFSVESKMIGFNVGAVPGEDHEEFGRTREESVEIARLLAEAGLDLLDADNGSYDSWYWAHPPVYMPLACNLDDVSYLKSHTDLPVVCAGRMEDPDTAVAAVADGRIDAVGIARQFLADGQYVSKVRDGDVLDIRPCIACHNGCFGVYRYKGLPAAQSATPLGRCAINPQTFQEEKYRVTPVDTPRRVAVIGGGIGGMEVARVATQRGHQVDLYEASDRLGGVFIAAAAPSFKEKDRMLIEWYRRQVAQLPIDVHLNTRIDEDGLAGLDVDDVVVATGARPRDLPIPGIDADHVLEAIDYLNGDRPVTGDHVVVLGGGLTGCEIAYDLALKGRTATIVEMQDDLLTVKELSAANSNMLRDLIRYHHIGVRLNARVTRIDADTLTIDTPEGSSTLPADTVIVSAGYVPGAPLAQAAERLTSTAAAGGAGRPRVHVVGDALEVGNLKHVVWRADDVALAI